MPGVDLTGRPGIPRNSSSRCAGGRDCYDRRSEFAPGRNAMGRILRAREVMENGMLDVQNHAHGRFRMWGRPFVWSWGALGGGLAMLLVGVLGIVSSGASVPTGASDFGPATPGPTSNAPVAPGKAQPGGSGAKLRQVDGGT